MGAHGLPMFHALGAFMYAAAVIHHFHTPGKPFLIVSCEPQPINGFVVGVFKPFSPPIVPTPDVVWHGISNAGSDFSWSVPSFIQVAIQGYLHRLSSCS